MRALQFEGHGGPEILSLADRTLPAMGRSELLVEVRAAGVNHTDLLYCEGIFDAGELPVTPGADFAGVVTDRGAAVTKFEVGDRVVGSDVADKRYGSHAEEVLTRDDHVAHLPKEVAFETGAAIGKAGVTAWHALHDRGEIEPDERVLIHGGSGGVGHLAVQLARVVDMTVVATAGNDRRCDQLLTLGVTEAINYSRDDLDAALEGAAGEGFNLIVDNCLDQYARLDVELAAPQGRVCVLEFCTKDDGVAALEQSTLRTGLLKSLDFRLTAVSNADASAALEQLCQLADENALTPSIAARYPLTAAETAYETLERPHFGRILLVPGMDE